MTDRLTLGYRQARICRTTPVAAPDDELRGHEFHYTTVEPAGDALELSARWGTRTDGFATPTLLASYLHVHPGGDPAPVARFVRACTGHRFPEHGAVPPPPPAGSSPALRRALPTSLDPRA
jgi:cobyrinic acid a,c-diamide synthase